MTLPAITLADLAGGLAGWRVGHGYARGPCPCCGSRTGGWAAINDAGAARVGCHACNDWRGVRRAFGLDGGELSGRAFRPPPKATGRTLAPDLIEDADALHAVYRVFEKHMGMDPERRRSVMTRDRGIPAHIRLAMAGLLDGVPGDDGEWRDMRRALLADLDQVAPPEFLRRVPELAGRESGSFAVLRGRRHAHYFEPWRDEQGRIQALRAYMGKRADAKYLPTAGRTGPVLHVAYGTSREAVATRPWLFTEAWMKSEVAAHALKVTAVAFPGVSAKQSWRRAIEIKQRLAPDAPAYVAFDAECWASRLDIGVLALELALELQRASGRPAGFAVWDAAVDAEGEVAPKGIDDAVAAGVEVRLVSRHALASYVAPLLERSESHAVAA